MKKSFLLPLLLMLALVGCEDNTKQADTNNDKEENTIPYWWSPAGHIYISETTWENSPADDKYWVWVLDFFSKDSALWYETDLRSLEYNGCPAYERVGYDFIFPNKLILYFSPNKSEERVLFFNDTTSIDASIWDITYTIFK